VYSYFCVWKNPPKNQRMRILGADLFVFIFATNKGIKKCLPCCFAALRPWFLWMQCDIVGDGVECQWERGVAISLLFLAPHMETSETKRHLQETSLAHVVWWSYFCNPVKKDPLPPPQVWRGKKKKKKKFRTRQTEVSPHVCEWEIRKCVCPDGSFSVCLLRWLQELL
jgi:hypothetical protein